jgi:hypothetical protein
MYGGKTGLHGTPVPIREREIKSRGSSEVVTYFMDPEEIKRRYPTTPMKKPIGTAKQNLEEQKRLEEKKIKTEGATENMVMAANVKSSENTKKELPTLEQYLELRIQGIGRTDIVKNHFKINPNIFYKLLDQWKIKSYSAEEKVIEHYKRLKSASPGEGSQTNTLSDEPESSTSVLDRQDYLSIDPKQKDAQKGSQEVTKGVHTDGGRERETGDQTDVSGGGVGDQNEAEPKPAEALRFVSVRIPIYNVGTNSSQQAAKIISEFEELEKELDMGTGDRGKILHELFDLMNATFHWLAIDISQLIVGDPDTKFEFLNQLIGHHNQMHIEKLKSYAAERGWEVY